MRSLAEHDLVARYEELRGHVLAGRHDLGFALFQRAGMAAWLDAWSECSAVPPATDAVRERDADESPVFVNQLQAEVARVLAGMALGAWREVTA